MQFDLSTMVPNDKHVPASRIHAMLQSKDRLPPDMKSLFDDLFIQNKPEAQIVSERGLTADQVSAKTNSMMRMLKTAVA